MAKAILCVGDKTDLVLEKLEYNVGGIELIGCPFVSGLEKVINSSGKLSKILIFERSIDGEIPDIIKSSAFETIFILNDIEKMQKYDIDYYGQKHIQIVNNGGKQMSFPFMKELISASELEDYLLYKADNISGEVEEETEEGAPTLVNNNIEREVEEEDTPVLVRGNSQKNEQLFDIPQEEREVSLEKEASVINVAPITNIRTETSEQRIKTLLNYYKTGCILTFVGTPKSYTTTTAYNVARTIAKLDNTVALIDLDTQNYPLGAINKDIFKQVNQQQTNFLQKAFRETNMIQNSLLIETNLHLLTSALNQDSLNIKDNLELLYKLIEKYRAAYKVMIFDIQLKDINALKDLLNMSAKIIFNITASNKDYLMFMRNVETADETLRDPIFNRSCYISVNETTRPLLNTNKKDLSALDFFLQNEYQIINELKYENIPKIGTIISDKQELDYLQNTTKINDKEISKFILRILGDMNE